MGLVLLSGVKYDGYRQEEVEINQSLNDKDFRVGKFLFNEFVEAKDGFIY